MTSLEDVLLVVRALNALREIQDRLGQLQIAASVTPLRSVTLDNGVRLYVTDLGVMMDNATNAVRLMESYVKLISRDAA